MLRKKKVAIVTTHPIQYNAPLFKLLAERNNIIIKVFYTWEQSKGVVFDPDFNQNRSWDIPLLDGYEYQFLKNISFKPGSDHFFGIINHKIVHQISEWAPDALLVYGWSFVSHLMVIIYFKGRIPVFFRGDSTLIDENKVFSIKKILRRNFLRWVYSFIDIAFYVGKYNRDYYLKNGVSENALVFAPHAVENDRFFCTNKDDLVIKAIKDDFFITENDIIFLFAGKFHSKKDCLILINSFNEIDNHNIHLILAGSGILECEMKFLAKDNKRIHFMPFQNQSRMPILYKMCDVFILPSKGPGETWGLAVNEAMASGLGIIVSDKCGCSFELVENGVNGFIFRSGDAKDLKNKLMLISDKKVLKKMGAESIKIIQQFSFERTSEIFEESILQYQKCS